VNGVANRTFAFLANSQAEAEEWVHVISEARKSSMSSGSALPRPLTDLELEQKYWKPETFHQIEQNFRAERAENERQEKLSQAGDHDNTVASGVGAGTGAVRESSQHREQSASDVSNMSPSHSAMNASVNDRNNAADAQSDFTDVTMAGSTHPADGHDSLLPTSVSQSSHAAHHGRTSDEPYHNDDYDYDNSTDAQSTADVEEVNRLRTKYNIPSEVVMEGYLMRVEVTKRAPSTMSMVSSTSHISGLDDASTPPTFWFRIEGDTLSYWKSHSHPHPLGFVVLEDITKVDLEKPRAVSSINIVDSAVDGKNMNDDQRHADSSHITHQARVFRIHIKSTGEVWKLRVSDLEPTDARVWATAVSNARKQSIRVKKALRAKELAGSSALRALDQKIFKDDVS
jgi:hypothetical protein